MLGNLHGVETPAGGGFCISPASQSKLDDERQPVQPRGCIYFAQNLADTRVSMHGLSIEQRGVEKTSLSCDLAQHIMRRSKCGRIVVATENPNGSMAAVRKQWIHMLRRLYVERARTLNAERINQLVFELDRLQNVSFSAKSADAMNGCRVVFATANDLAQLAPDCTTLYVTYEFPKEWLYLMTSWMTLNGLVVIYGQK